MVIAGSAPMAINGPAATGTAIRSHAANRIVRGFVLLVIAGRSMFLWDSAQG